MSLESFLSKEEQRTVVDAIGIAEKRTSGEIRVHVEPTCKCGDPYERAVEVFNKLGMYATEARNGVLIYVAYKSHKLAIIGDDGINKKVGADFWAEERNLLISRFRDGQYADGLAEAIKQIGENLSKYFPYQEDDVNELSDEISYESE